MQKDRRVGLISFDAMGSVSDGFLVAVESERDLPFILKRVFYIYGVPADVARARHANRNSQFVMVCLRGRCCVRTNDGEQQVDYTLDRPDQGLYTGPMVWKEMHAFSADCVLLVMSDCFYDASEYVRDYDVFLAEVNRTRTG